MSDPQIDLMQRAGPHRRVEMALRLSSEVIGLSRRAIDRAFPALDAGERRLKFVEVQYGSELADRVRAWLAARGRTA